MAHGVDYVAWPRLIPPVDAIYYEGPGFRSGQRGKGFKLSFLSKHGVGGVRRVLETRTKQLHTTKIEEIEMGTKKRVD
jgi:phosphatidylinositol 4-phosphatase